MVTVVGLEAGVGPELQSVASSFDGQQSHRVFTVKVVAAPDAALEIRAVAAVPLQAQGRCGPCFCSCCWDLIDEVSGPIMALQMESLSLWCPAGFALCPAGAAAPLRR